jgi:hypothetical protein
VSSEITPLEVDVADEMAGAKELSPISDASMNWKTWSPNWLRLSFDLKFPSCGFVRRDRRSPEVV